MKNVLLFLLMSFFVITPVFSLEITIAPILSITNGVNERYEKSISNAYGLRDSLHEVGKNETITFTTIDSPEFGIPNSTVSALAYCKEFSKELLLYGFVQTNENILYSEIRLLDFNGKTVLATFFSADQVGNEDRLAKDMARKILDFIETSFGYASSSRNEVDRHLVLEIPALLGYSTPISGTWNELLTGTVAGVTGIDLIPDDGLTSFGGKSSYVSAGLRVGYRYSFGDPDTYDASLHSVDMMCLLGYNVRLSDLHAIYVSFGLSYSMEILSYNEKYAGEYTSMGGVAGCGFGFGYRFSLFPSLHLVFENFFLYQFHDEAMLSWSPKIGIAYKLYERKLESQHE